MSGVRVVEVDVLLRQSAWVRALAARLVADPERAEDLAQEALLEALERPPRAGGSLRGWLAAVLRNLVRQDARSERRRGERERRAARGEAVGAVGGEGEVLARAAAHRRLVELLMELEEPFRSALLLRYFDGLGPREIAARLDVPLDTVRSRLRRGLARMRARLDREGAREEWIGAFALLAGGERASPAPLAPGAGLGLGGIAMSAKWKLAVVVAALAAGGLWLLSEGVEQ